MLYNDLGLPSVQSRGIRLEPPCCRNQKQAFGRSFWAAKRTTENTLPSSMKSKPIRFPFHLCHDNRTCLKFDDVCSATVADARRLRAQMGWGSLGHETIADPIYYNFTLEKSANLPSMATSTAAARATGMAKATDGGISSAG